MGITLTGYQTHTMNTMLCLLIEILVTVVGEEERQCGDGEVRLLNGSLSSEGLVEICYNGRWGAICQDHWDEQDTMVACHQAGFPGNSKACYYYTFIFSPYLFSLLRLTLLLTIHQCHTLFHWLFTTERTLAVDSAPKHKVDQISNSQWSLTDLHMWQ